MSAAAASAAIIADSVAAAGTSIHAKRTAPGNAQHCSTASLRAQAAPCSNRTDRAAWRGQAEDMRGADPLSRAL